MPRLWLRLLAVLVPLSAIILIARSYNVSARIQLSWPLAIHPDGQDDGAQIPLNADKSANGKSASAPGEVADSKPGTFSRKIVAVGDLHGDLGNAYKVLKMAGVVTEAGDWSGDVDFFVQTGDIIDR